MALSKNESFPADINQTPPEEEVPSTDEISPCVPGQTKTSTARVLTREEQDRLSGERALVSDFKLMKLEKDAQKNWDLFYKRNTTNFFKDRHWTTREFEELKACREVRKRVQHIGSHSQEHYVPRGQYFAGFDSLNPSCYYLL